VLLRKAVEQAGAQKRRVGIVDERSGPGHRRPAIAGVFPVGPGYVFRQPRRPALACDGLAEPDRRLFALAAQTDQLDFDVGRREMPCEVGGRAELDRPRDDLPHDRAPEFGVGRIILDPHRPARASRPAIGVQMQPRTLGYHELLGPGPDRQHPFGNPIHLGVMSDTAAHRLIAVDSQNV